jgi:hypothetical protein
LNPVVVWAVVGVEFAGLIALAARDRARRNQNCVADS